MKVKVSNPRSGSVDYVSQALKLSVPAYTTDMLVDLPEQTADRWVAQLKKDGLGVVPVTATPPPPPPKVEPTSPKVEPKGEPKTATSSKDSKNSTSKK